MAYLWDLEPHDERITRLCVARFPQGPQVQWFDVGQTMYYSPNNRLKSDAVLYRNPHNNNPFQPDGIRPAGTRYRDLLRPRPWSKAFGWTSFIPNEPCYTRSPRSIISTLQRSPPIERISDPAGQHHVFSMADDEWRTLEKNIYTAVCALKGAFHLPCVLPFLPHTLGYNIHQEQLPSLHLSIHESREWFLVWIGALSYCLYASEVHPDHQFRKKGYPRWRKVLEDAGLSSAWIDEVVHSPICDYSSVHRIGCILDLYEPEDSRDRPPAKWFIDAGVPIWYPWGEKEERKALVDNSFSSLRPPDDPQPSLQLTPRPLPSMRAKWRADARSARREVEVTKQVLQAGLQAPTIATQNSEAEGSSAPKRRTVEELEEAIREGEARVADREAKLKEAEAGLGVKREPEWVAFFRQREARYPAILAAESPQSRQKRLNRLREPPMSSAPVFEWTLDPDSEIDVWIRVPVPAKWRSDTLSNYGSQRKRYDAFFNEWDCCDEFGEITQEEEDEMDSWIPQTFDPEAPISSTVPLPATPPAQSSTAPSSLYTSLPAQDPPLDLFQPIPPSENVPSHPVPPSENVPSQPQNAPHSPHLPEDPHGQEVEEMFGYFYGYIAPPAGATIPEQRDDKRLDIFFRLLGQPVRIDEQERARYFSCKPWKSAQFLVDSIIDQSKDYRGVWDLRDDCISPVRLRSRFRTVRRIPFESPDNQKAPESGDDIFDYVEAYYILQESDSTVPWRLAFISASAALTACRLPDTFTNVDIATWFAQRGVPFRVFYPYKPVIHSVSRPTPTFAIPVRPLNHKFTKEDYNAYIHLRTLVLGQPHMQAAMKRGGIVWRLSIGTLGVSSVSGPPSQWHRTRRLRLGESDLVDDTLTMNELDLICGAYECVSGKQSIPSLLLPCYPC